MAAVALAAEGGRRRGGARGRGSISTWFVPENWTCGTATARGRRARDRRQTAGAATMAATVAVARPRSRGTTGRVEGAVSEQLLTTAAAPAMLDATSSANVLLCRNVAAPTAPAAIEAKIEAENEAVAAAGAKETQFIVGACPAAGSIDAATDAVTSLSSTGEPESRTAAAEAPEYCFMGSMDGSEESLWEDPYYYYVASAQSPVPESASGTSGSSSSSSRSPRNGIFTDAAGSPEAAFEAEPFAVTHPQEAETLAAKQQLSADAKEWTPATGKVLFEPEEVWQMQLDEWPSEYAEWNPWQSEAEAVAEVTAADMLHSLNLLGDESLLGPDGDMYEIFYPPDGLPEAPEPLPEYDGIGSPEECRLLELEKTVPLSSTQISSRIPADFGIGDIVTYMTSVQTARYPARARLFELVRSAASTALGDNFSRVALVGSAALRIDTPDSDLDAVVFTRAACGEGGEETLLAPCPAQTLRRVAQVLPVESSLGPLRLQLVDCARVPVLTVLATLEPGDILSLDLTVDQPLGEWHVLWFLSQRSEPEPEPAPLHQVPAPRPDGWEQGLEAAALRCVKWWLRRRRIPVSKEGGYPTVAWTLMVVHVLRCSLLLVDDARKKDQSEGASTSYDDYSLLGALAAFFDRFAGGGPAGTLHFARDQAQFLPQATTDPPKMEATEELKPPSSSMSPANDLSILDPTTTHEDGSLLSAEAVADLTPKISPATRLLQAYELRRAALLSSTALHNQPKGEASGAALQALFRDVGEITNMVPSYVPEEPLAVIVLQGETLRIGLLQQVHPKYGWNAHFLHRSDWKTQMAIRPCAVNERTGTLNALGRQSNLVWFSPSEVVCCARPTVSVRGASKRSYGHVVHALDAEDRERWCDLQATLLGAPAAGAS